MSTRAIVTATKSWMQYKDPLLHQTYYSSWLVPHTKTTLNSGGCHSHRLYSHSCNRGQNFDRLSLVVWSLTTLIFGHWPLTTQIFCPLTVDCTDPSTKCWWGLSTLTELHAGLKTSTVSKDYGCCEECCSLEGFIKGIMFYGGFAGIHAMMVCLPVSWAKQSVQ